MSGGAVDLSQAAIAARQAGQARGLDHAGRTARELIANAAAVLDAANRNRRIAQKAKSSSRENRAMRKAKEASLTAAVQIRLAEMTPLDRGYRHHLTLTQIQDVERDVQKLVGDDTPEEWAQLAVDTHLRVREQRHRARQGADA